MDLTRREMCALLAIQSSTSDRPTPAWTAEWDRALITAAVETQDGAYDPAEQMLRRQIGPEYHYHTNLRSTAAHPTRDSLDYALMLLEAGGDERVSRARKVIERLLPLQETDPNSKWYGLWGYYLEEPAPKMSPADWNWADFNGSLLLLIEARHGQKLPPSLRRAVREAIRHAAYSVRRRNVSMTYTNIAVQGTFVTLAAAELAGDADLKSYTVDRFHRFDQTVAETGSFAEYNSPTYMNVTIGNLTRIRMLVKDGEMLDLAARLHRLAWLHLGRHWHAPTKQLAGPMSRCYSTDIGQPLWLQKALGGRLAFASLDEVRGRRGGGSGEVGLLDYHCPEEIAPLFLELREPHQHRELFLPGVQGTTWLDRRFSLGSVNRGTFWVQQRPLVAYWPGGYLQARVVKDDYDFASALFYGVQEKNYVLGLWSFKSPGGDKHPSLDPVANGQFTAARLRARFDLAGVPPDARMLAGGAAAKLGAKLPVHAPVTVEMNGLRVAFRIFFVHFDGYEPAITIDREEDMLTVSLDWIREAKPLTVRWSEVRNAYAVIGLAIGENPAAGEFRSERPVSLVRTWWRTPAGELGLAGSPLVQAAAEQDRAFSATLDGRPVPEVRLA